MSRKFLLINPGETNKIIKYEAETLRKKSESLDLIVRD